MDEKRHAATVGLVGYREYRHEGLSIRYFPSSSHLVIREKRNVLMVDMRHGKLQVRHYVPGAWEEQLEAAARVAMSPA